MTWTPILAWPARKFRGSPGYSARHYASLAGAPEDPLRVAERILAFRDSGESREIIWARLCENFALVIAALQSVPQTPAIKALVRQAKREAKRAA